jgi:hypothetical protein
MGDFGDLAVAAAVKALDHQMEGFGGRMRRGGAGVLCVRNIERALRPIQEWMN